MTIELLIEEYQVDVIIGILDHERTSPQPVVIDARITYRYEGEYLDYAQAAKLLATRLQEGRFGLLEEALPELRDVLLSHWPSIISLDITLRKPTILSGMVVG
ncbi:MAG: dihydroneopterin aldolase, partial [Campylobacterales bacterium]